MKGIVLTLDSVDAKLMLAGGKFYDLATAIPYNPASGSLKGAEYTLTAVDGIKYELDAERGLVGQIAANGTKLIYSDAGIISYTQYPTPNTPTEAVRFVKDSAGNITQITAPNGTQLSYEYDSIGNLVSVKNSATGEISKYGYEMGTTTPDSSSSRLTVISNSTGGAVINDDGTTTPITRDLGGIANFNGKSIIRTNDARQIYSFNLKPSELNTTNSQTVLIGVEGAGDVRINGATSVYIQGNYRVFAVDKAGINLLEITNPGATFKLSLVGDLNSDNRVDGLDTQLLTDTSVDLNRDGVSNAQDLQLLGGNYGLVGNNAPVITPVVGLTHVDLSTRIDLSKLATDIEGDLVAFSVKSGVGGKVEISADGKYAIYTPDSGFGGTGGFELIASDGFSSSKANIDVNVSTAALINLGITNRHPKLAVGDKYQLQIIGDFADQKGVSLSADYLTYGIINSSQPSVITVDSQGLITAISDGTGVITAYRNGISAFTATRVGTFNPTTTLDSLIKDAETNGLNAYPGAVTLIPGMERQILVSPKTSPQNPNSLTDSNTGTNYYIGNPNILEVSSAGLITVKQTGSTTVTVINHGAEDTISIQVELPLQNNTQLGTNGGAIQTADGSLVTIAPGALTTDTTVSIQQLTSTQLTLPLPTDYQLVGAFQLNVGDKTLKTAAQIAIPAPTGLASGTEVFFLQKGELPNEQGVMQPIWLIRESGKVDTDGMIRTSSPPWNGVTQTGEFSIVVPTFNYSRIDVEVKITKIAAVYNGAIILAILSAGLGSIPEFQDDLIDNVLDDPLTTVQDGSIDILIHIPTLLNNVIPNPQVSVLTIPAYGLPYQTTANIELNPGQIPTAKIDIVPRASGEYQPEISSVELKIEDFNGSVAPLLTLTGENFGEDLSALKVDLISATGDIINLPIITSKSAFSRLVVQPSNLLPINAQSQLQITRTYQTAYQPNPTQFKSELVDLPDEPLYRDVSLVPLTWDNKIAVYNTTNPQSVIASSPVGSPDLLLAKIPVGKAGITSDGPRFIAVTSDATVAYTPLEGEGRVAVIDLISLQQVNTNDGDIDPTIALPAGATPFSIVIGTLDKYAYVADRNPANGKGQIYVIDIDPRSVKYNKHIQTIQVGTNLTELSQMALSRDGKSLFITAPKATDNRGHIIAVNVDITTEGDVDSQWHQEVSNLVTNLGVTGITAAPIVDITQPNRVQMVITNRQDDNYGFGVITIEDGNFATAKIDYKPLLLGSSADYFDVNEAVAVTITSDGKYGFVAGKNSRNIGRLIPSVDADSRAGSNIGIIKDPLTSNAKLVAATLPIPDGRVNGLALSGDGKVLTAAYQGLGSGSIFAFDVEEIIKTIEHPELSVFEFLGENSLIFNDQTRPATIDDL